MNSCRNNFRRPVLLVASFLLVATIAGCFTAKSSQVEHGNVAFDVSPDGQQILFAAADGDLYLLDLNAQKVSQLIKTADIESSPAYSPDGKTIIYAAAADDRQGSHIFRISLDGTNGEQLTNDADVSDCFPRYSPDGSRIAFARAHLHRKYSMGGWTWDHWDVYVMDADGSKLTRLTRKNYYGISRVEFAPDGKSISFSADNNRAASDLVTNVFEIPVDGAESPITGVPQPSSTGKYAAWASEPGYSSEGKNLVVTSDRTSPFHYDLVVIDVRSGDAKALNATTISRYNKHPVFAPDGKRILFLAGRKWNASSRPIFSLWSIDVDGKNAKEIAGSQLFTAPETWSP